MRRRWWVVLIVLALTGGLAAGTVDAFPPTYTVEGDYLLERASGPADVQEASPSVLAAIVESRGFGEDPQAPFDQMPYEVVPVEGSVISLRVVWSDAGTAEEGLDLLLATLESTVREIVPSPEEGAAVELLGRGVSAASTPLQLTEDTDATFDEVATAFAAGATVRVRGGPGAETRFDPSDYTARVLVAVLDAPRNVKTYLDRAGIEEFSADFDERGPAPLVTLSVVGTDRDAVLSAYADAEAELAEELAALQSQQDDIGANPTVARALARPDGPTLIENNLQRPLAVMVLLGLLVAVAAALSVDGFLARRDGSADDVPGGTGGGPAGRPARQRAVGLEGEAEPAGATGGRGNSSPSAPAPPDRYQPAGSPLDVGPRRGREGQGNS